MKTLNQHSTKIFLRLIEQMEKRTHAKFLSEGFMPLVLELIGGINTPFGRGLLYSLAHYYEQNGDLMCDPEMCFIVIKPTDGNNYISKIFPFLYHLDSLGIYEESIFFENNTIASVDIKRQNDQTEFANIWLKNIQQQEFEILN